MILTTAYFPSLHYMRLMSKADGKVLIEACENYQKQSCRNRFRIASDKGIQSLTIPVHAYNNIPVKDVTVDYSLKWQKEHLRAIATCYGSAPFFPYVMDKIENLFSIHEKFLLDYNMIILKHLADIMSIDVEIGYTETFEPMSVDDTRLITSRHFKDPNPEHYYQVFSENGQFLPDLSVIDFMMCEGFRG